MAKKLAKVHSLRDLFNRAASDPAYEKLLRFASMNLGGPEENAPLEEHKRNLINNANETDEDGVVDEINHMR